MALTNIEPKLSAMEPVSSSRRTWLETESKSYVALDPITRCATNEMTANSSSR